METATHQSSTLVEKKCHHCGKVSSSLQRCSQCQLVWYCDSTCQSLSWKPSGGKEGHRKECRRLRKLAVANATTASTAQATASASPSGERLARGSDAKGALVELMEHVHAMDCNEAYKQMCLAKDEIERLQSEIPDILQRSQENLSQPELPNILETSPEVETEYDNETKATGSMVANGDTSSSKVNGASNNDKEMMNTQSVYLDKGSEKVTRASGSFLDQGGKCSIEYLPNVKCYSITLAAAEDDTLNIPQSNDGLKLTITPADSMKGRQFSSTTYFEAKLYQWKDTNSSPSTTDHGQILDLLLSVYLLTTTCKTTTNPSASISLDSNSISLRIQLQHEITTMAMESMDVMDKLLGIEGSPFPSITTRALELNYLRCRTCQNPIIDPSPGSSNVPNENKTHTAIIQSVLPLPSGYWDDISDYLICYDGQATVDFTSSSTNAIPKTALEDDTILVLHRHDLAEGGVCTLGVKGYGEHSSHHLNDTGSNNSTSQAWKEKSAIKGESSKSVTCVKCCSTLGFVSDHNSNTFRLYKHLLDCGSPNNSGGATAFSKYTCGSFLAKEMVRYAESEAIYTFIVGISDENDWTRVHNSGACILLRMLSWDTPMAFLGGSSDSSSEDADLHQIHFQKVVKVIFEERSDKKELTSDHDDPLEWTWRGTDFCCLPPMGDAESNVASLNLDESSTSPPQTKASSTRIFFSEQEWSELRDTLICGSHYFSNAMKDAVVMTKLGLPNSDQEQTASLSFLHIA